MMSLRHGTLSVAAMILVAGAASATTIVSEKGTRLIKNGAPVADGQFLTVADFTGDVSPFDLLDGADANNSATFFVSWLHGYAPIVGTITSATLEIGIWDADATDGTQFNGFFLDTVSLAYVSSIIGARTYQSDTYAVYTIPIQSSFLPLLADGFAGFSLGLKNGRTLSGALTASNGAILDYSKLTINTATVAPPPTAIPEPGTWAMMIGGLGIVGCAIRRREQRALA